MQKEEKQRWRPEIMLLNTQTHKHLVSRSVTCPCHPATNRNASLLLQHPDSRAALWPESMLWKEITKCLHIPCCSCISAFTWGRNNVPYALSQVLVFSLITLQNCQEPCLANHEWLLNFWISLTCILHISYISMCSRLHESTLWFFSFSQYMLMYAFPDLCSLGIMSKRHDESIWINRNNAHTAEWNRWGSVQCVHVSAALAEAIQVTLITASK